jgi:transposase InsO family protein
LPYSSSPEPTQGQFALKQSGASRQARHLQYRDQGSQFTGSALTGALAKNDIAISMDGKGAWGDNVFVKCMWRSVKYEEVYLRAYDSASEDRASIGRYLDFYNGRRPHSSLSNFGSCSRRGSRRAELGAYGVCRTT